MFLLLVCPFISLPCRKQPPLRIEKNTFSTVLGSCMCSSPKPKISNRWGGGGIFFKIQNVVKLQPSKSALLWSYLHQSLTDLFWKIFWFWHGPGLAKCCPVLKADLWKKDFSLTLLPQNRRCGIWSQFFPMPKGIWACIFQCSGECTGTDRLQSMTA